MPARASTIIFNTNTDTITLDGSVETGTFRGTPFTVEQQNGVATFLFAGNLNFGATDIVTGGSAAMPRRSSLETIFPSRPAPRSTSQLPARPRARVVASAAGRRSAEPAVPTRAWAARVVAGGGGGAGGPGDNSVGSDVGTSYGSNAGGGPPPGTMARPDRPVLLVWLVVLAASDSTTWRPPHLAVPAAPAEQADRAVPPAQVVRVAGRPCGIGSELCRQRYFCSGNPHGGQGGQGGTGGGMGTNGGVWRVWRGRWCGRGGEKRRQRTASCWR